VGERARRLREWLFSKKAALAFAVAISVLGTIFLVISIFVPAFDDWGDRGQTTDSGCIDGLAI
jgi:hypothetical protein